MKPRQERSRRTRDRIVAAFVELLRDHPFESVSLAEACRRAGVTTGAFYGHFRSKDGVLSALYEEHDRQLHALVQELKQDRPWDGLSLPDFVTRAVGEVVAYYRKRQWFLRALALFARNRPEAIPEACRRLRDRLHRDVAEILLEWRNDLRHPEPEEAATFAVLLLGALCRDKILFGDAPHASSSALTDDRLSKELATAILAYLGATS